MRVAISFEKRHLLCGSSLRINDGKVFSHAADVPLTLLMYPFGVAKYLFDNYRLLRIKS